MKYTEQHTSERVSIALQSEVQRNYYTIAHCSGLEIAP
jgi:hypothetical protein